MTKRPAAPAAADGLEAHASYCAKSMEPNSECDCQPQARSLADLLCPPHANLEADNHLEPFDNCIACIRAERDELRTREAKAEEAYAALRQQVDEYRSGYSRLATRLIDEGAKLTEVRQELEGLAVELTTYQPGPEARNEYYFGRRDAMQRIAGKLQAILGKHFGSAPEQGGERK